MQVNSKDRKIFNDCYIKLDSAWLRKGPMDCSSSCVRSLAHFWEKSLLFSVFFPPHISSQKFSPSSFYSSSAKPAVWVPCEILYGFLLLMPFSFGDRLALSVGCFLLSLILQMDPPWPSLLSPCHMWKVPLTTIDIISLVEYWQDKFIWLSVECIYIPFLCAHTHCGEFFLSLHFLSSLGSALNLPRAQIPANLSKPLASEGDSTGSKHISVAKPDPGK